MRIGLNLLPVREGIGGTWNYISAVLRSLADHDRQNEYIVFATDHSVPMVPTQVNFSTVLLRVPADRRPLRVFYENTFLRFDVAAARLDCLHHVFGTLPSAGSLPTVVTMYDLIEFERPTDFGFLKRRYLRAARRHAVAGATILAPMSDATAADLQQRLGASRDRMEVILPPLADDFVRGSPDAVASFRKRHGLPGEFWLAVADALPRKNYERLLAAFAEFRQARPNAWPLVIRGESTAEFRMLVERHGLAASVSFLGRLPAEEMPLLYSAASALVFPSIFEGGGLPVIEAMACGCPVVASNISTTREFAGAAALTFDPENVTSIAQALRACEEDEEQRSLRVAEGLRERARLSTAMTAAACLRAYGRAIAASR